VLEGTWKSTCKPDLVLLAIQTLYMYLPGSAGRVRVPMGLLSL